MAIQTKQSLGDVIDRITILLIKAFHFKEPYEFKNVIKELQAVLPGLELDDEQWKQVQETFLELRKINYELWQLEEEIRYSIRNKDDPSEVVETIKKIHEQNYERADAKRWINDELDPDFGEMKDYESTTNNES